MFTHERITIKGSIQETAPHFVAAQRMATCRVGVTLGEYERGRPASAKIDRVDETWALAVYEIAVCEVGGGDYGGALVE